MLENFRSICLGKYGLDPAHYFTSPGSSWDALLKKTGVKRELLTDIDMHLFIERGIRGGISTVSKRYKGTRKAYVKVARYEPLRGGTCIPLPPKLRNKKAIINVQNRKDNECLKCSLRAALFPTPKGKNPLRT